MKERCLDAKYRTTPFSERPAPGDVDLELRTPRHRLLLQDLDASSKCENGIWRYNTLAHYKVENKSTLALLFRHHTTNTTNTSSSYNLSLSDRSEKSTTSLAFHNGFMTNSPIINNRNCNSILNGHNIDESVHNSNVGKDSNGVSTLRVYHLVKSAAEHDPQNNQVKNNIFKNFFYRLINFFFRIKW